VSAAAGEGPVAAPGHPEILRITCPNPGAMTLAGTNTYLVGRGPAWVIDPGPADAGHIGRVREAAERLGGIGGVLLTHAHLDHSDGVELLGVEPAWGGGSGSDEARSLLAVDTEAAVEPAPPREPPPTAEVGPFKVVPTPGHAADHAAFVHGDACFCGDLVLGEGSSIVPPAAGGGSMSDYMESLDRLEGLGAGLLCPGHGGWITDPAGKIAEYRSHRAEREQRLRAELEAGERSRARLLAAVWDDVPAPMRPAAALAMRAHLEKLAAEGMDLSDLGP
jgi:glyoxylase-like metal-dependent hydrolase (beta-lactamase superfamily II)